MLVDKFCAAALFAGLLIVVQSCGSVPGYKYSINDFHRLDDGAVRVDIVYRDVRAHVSITGPVAVDSKVAMSKNRFFFDYGGHMHAIVAHDSGHVTLYGDVGVSEDDFLESDKAISPMAEELGVVKIYNRAAINIGLLEGRLVIEDAGPKWP